MLSQCAKRAAGTKQVDFNDACGEETENVHFKLLVMSPVVFPHNNHLLEHTKH